MKMTGKVAQLIAMEILGRIGIEVTGDDDGDWVTIIPEVEDIVVIHNVFIDAFGVEDYRATYSGQRFLVEWIDVDLELLFKE